MCKGGLGFQNVWTAKRTETIDLCGRHIQVLMALSSGT